MEANPLSKPLVIIEWLDSHATCGWTTDDVPETPLSCISAGFLWHDGEDAKTIVAHVTDEDHRQRAGQMTIPSVAIVKMTIIPTIIGG